MGVSDPKELDDLASRSKEWEQTLPQSQGIITPQTPKGGAASEIHVGGRDLREVLFWLPLAAVAVRALLGRPGVGVVISLRAVVTPSPSPWREKQEGRQNKTSHRSVLQRRSKSSESALRYN